MKGVKKALKRAEQDVRHAAKDLEKDVRHGTQKATVKLQLDSERDWAREALETANRILSEITALIAAKKEAMTALQHELGSLTEKYQDSVAGLKLTEASTALQPTEKLFANLLDAQSVISIQQQIASTQRGRVSLIPNLIGNADAARAQGEPGCENPDFAERQAKEACRMAQAAAQLIKDTMAKAIKDAEVMDIALSKTKALIAKAKEIQEVVEQGKEFKTSEEASKPLDPMLAERFRRVNQYAIGVAIEREARIKELEAQLAAMSAPPVLHAATAVNLNPSTLTGGSPKLEGDSRLKFETTK